jgi:hypothetical protein
VQILSHRGLWEAPLARNTLRAFVESFAAGYGAELDVRDAAGELLVSHDPPLGSELRLNDVLREYRDAGQPGTLAINIKADGLASAILDCCNSWAITSFFCFDQSVPDLMNYMAVGVPAFTRQSDIETAPILYERAAGVWIDSFYDENWFDESALQMHLDAGKHLCLVSPELHGRTQIGAWSRWASWGACAGANVFVCTDRPHELAALLS